MDKKWYDNTTLGAWIWIIFAFLPAFLTYQHSKHNYSNIGGKENIIYLFLPFIIIKTIEFYQRSRIRSKRRAEIISEKLATKAREDLNKKNIAKQIQAEHDEIILKQKNDIISISEFLQNSRKYKCIQKYELKRSGDIVSAEDYDWFNSLGEPGWSKNLDEVKISEQHFYVDNFFEAIGTLTEARYGFIPVFHKANDVNKGYQQDTIPGFLLTLSVETPNGKEGVAVGIPYKHEKKDIKSSAGYNVVDQATPFDFLPFACHTGIKIKAKGSLSKMLKDKKNVPVGYYLIADITEISSV